MKSRRWMVVSGLLVALFLGACFRQDIRELVVHVPAMNTTDCSRLIQSALNRTDGVISVRPDIANRTMTIEYNSTKIAIKNIEYLIAGAGFDANDEKAKPEAKQALPPDCR